MIGVIDLNNVNQNLELSINSIMNKSTDDKANKVAERDNKFSYEEVNVNDASSSIYFTQYRNKVLINVYGPRETRFREKIKGDEGIVEVYSKFNYEASKEKTKKLNGVIQNFCESLIRLDSYPRCQVNICINVITFRDEKFLTATILNGLTFSLCISGIDLKAMALTTYFGDKEDKIDLLVSLDANKPNNILLLESSFPMQINKYKAYLEKSKEEIIDLYAKIKKVLLKKLI